MKNLLMLRLLIITPLSLFSGFSYAQGLFLKTLQPIDDEFRGYCLDVAGFGSRIRLDEPLRMHTCKYGEASEDQQFNWSSDNNGHITLPEYNRCLAVEQLEPGSQLYVQNCSDTTLQSWNMMPNGKIKSASQPDLCLTLANERKYAGAESWMTPVYHWRAVTLENCADNSHALQQLRWGHPAEQDKNYADSLGRNMPSEIASAISNLGNQLGTIAPTTELYKGQHRVYELGELEVAKDIAYGPHERHKLDVHTDKYRRSNSAMPVVVFFHGGGFVRGNRANSRNFVDYFASLGLVGVNATYRLAPEVKWPAGAEDVGKVITWVKENISEYGGDPDSIIVVGKSAGAAHVATYLFRPGVLEAPTATAAGAVLISGVYDLNSEQASEGSLAYYGKDLSKHPFMSVAGNIERSDIPVLLSISEYDPPNFKTAMTKLMHELTIEHERMPRVVQLLGHNHYSSNMAVGTQDTMLSAEVLELIHRVSRDNKQD